MAISMLAAICLVPGLFHILEVKAAADVTAPAGRVIGLELNVLGTTVHAFMGIPFAQPPVEDRRFRRAEPMEPWDGIYNATSKPNACSQHGEVGDHEHSLWALNTQPSEDCLYLNVWQPTPAPTGAAVLVWIYGGSFQSGSSALTLYDGRYLAATEGVIVVGINYRVSTLGFLYAGSDDAPGNVGLTDQVLALQWVQDNIAAFGGDPARVTLFGESAGAVSIGFHLMSPGSWNLFNRAILQSGTALMPDYQDSKAEAYSKTMSFVKAMGCPVDQGATEIIACLKDKDGQQLVNTSILGNTRFHPVVDGSFLPESPPVAYRNGAFKKTDILLGSNENEGFFFLAYSDAPGWSPETESLINKEQFTAAMWLIPDSNEFAVDAAAFHYTDWEHLDQESMYRDALDSLYSDYYFICPDVNTGRAYVRNGATAYMYRFAHVASNSPYPAWMGVLHGEEVPFVFGLPLDPVYGFNEEDKNLSRRMMRHWANFARTGNPNNGVEDAWSLFNGTDGGYVVLDTGEPRMRTGPSTVNCAFLDNYLKPLIIKTNSLINKTTCNTASGAPGCHCAGMFETNMAKFTMMVVLLLVTIKFLF